MSLYIEQIEQLVVLQKVDTEMLGLERILEDAPKQLRNLQEKQAYLVQQQEVIQEKIDVLLEQKGRIEFEIENDSQKVKKSKNKLMLVENTKEYHAMMREMDNLEKMNRVREEELNNLLADLNDLEGRKESLQKDIDALGETISAQQSTLDQELADKRARLEIQGGKRSNPAPLHESHARHALERPPRRL